MKNVTIVFLSLIILVSSSTVMAGLSAQGRWKKQQKLSHEEDFSNLKTGDKIAMICKACDSVSVLEIESTEEAMEFCKVGELIDCPSCKNVARIKRPAHGRSPNPPRGRPVVDYVDDHGEACLLIVKLD